jgi:hypothetical protein
MFPALIGHGIDEKGKNEKHFDYGVFRIKKPL